MEATPSHLQDPRRGHDALIKLHAPDFSNDGPDRPIFYLMLAHYQCQDRCLQPVVRRRALAIIRRGAARVFWLDGRPGTPRRRQADFDRLRTQIERTGA